MDDLIKKVREVFTKEKSNKQNELKIERIQHSIDKNNEESEKLMDEIFSRLKKGEKLENSFLDYCVYNFKGNAMNYLDQVTRFCDSLKELSGEKILIDYVGGTRTTTQVPIEPERFSRTIYLGRLSIPGYEISIPNRHLNAKTSELQKWTENKTREETAPNISINNFLIETFRYSQPTNQQKEMYQIIEKFPHEISDSKKEKGLEIRVFAPTYLNSSEIPIGVSIEYDSPIISSLIIGSKRVEEYLSKQNLTITRKVSETHPIPKL